VIHGIPVARRITVFVGVAYCTWRSRSVKPICSFPLVRHDAEALSVSHGFCHTKRCRMLRVGEAHFSRRGPKLLLTRFGERLATRARRATGPRTSRRWLMAPASWPFRRNILRSNHVSRHVPRCAVTRTSGIMSATMAYDEKLAERVRAILAERRGVTEKRLLGTLAFMVNGAMCCSVSRDGLLVRIDAEEREQLLRDPFASTMKLGARTMNGFLRIALEGLGTRARLEKWIARGIARVEAGRKKGPSRRASSSTAHRRKA